MIKFSYASILTCIVLVFVAINGLTVFATDYTSTNYILRNPIISIEGGRSTSASFEYFSGSGQTLTGENTSSSFIGRAGFLYFASATSPAVSATAGNLSVALSWTASQSPLANIEDYQVGMSTVSGSGYAYESAGTSLSLTKSNLINGTPYYFKVRAYAGGELLAESGEITSTPVASAGGGGGGGFAYIPPSTGIIFSGRAYPLSKVKILKDGQFVVQAIAGPDAKFQLQLMGLSAGDYTFSVIGEDLGNRTSQAFAFSIGITRGVTITVSGIFIAPTIDVDKLQVKQGENIAIFGQSAPSGAVTVSVNSPIEFFRKAQADKDGIYLLNFDTTILRFGSHSAKSKTTLKEEITPFGNPVGFLVGTETILKQEAPSGGFLRKRGDFNGDGAVNLIDFSIAAFWYNRPLSEDVKIIENAILNGDGVINLTDFSIMAFYWTG